MKLFFKSNKHQDYSYDKKYIKYSYLNIPICPINFFSSCSYHIVLLIKYAVAKLKIAQKILVVNRVNLTLFFSDLIGNITAAPNHPAAKLVRKSDKISQAIASIILSYLFFFFLSTPAFAGDLDNQFTISMYVNPTTSIASKALIVKDTEIRLVTDASGNPSCQIYASSVWQTAATSSTALSLNTWSHVACTYDKANIKVYINGVQTGSVAQTSVATDSATNLLVGQDDTAVYANFIGTVDQVNIYNYARSAKQIMEDLNAGHPSVGSPVGSYAAYWKFDEGHDNTIYDQSVNANTGTNHGASWTNDGKFGKALSFDGSASYVDAGSGASLNITTAVTLSAWIKLSALDGGSHMIIGRDDGTNRDYGFQIAGSNANFFTFSSNSVTNRNITGNTTLSTGIWYHLVGVYDGAQTKLYVNGTSDATPLSAVGDIDTDTTNVYIGNRKTDRYFNGSIDEVKIYPFALTASDIQTEYNHGSALKMGSFSDTSGLTGGAVASDSASALFCVPGDTSACSAPVGEWKFDEKVSGNSQTVYDTSSPPAGGGNNGTTVWGANASGMNCKVPGKYGSACKFDGVDDYVSVVDSSVWDFGTGDFTIEAWINGPASAAVGDYRMIIVNRTGSAYYWQVNTQITTGKLEFYVRNNAGGTTLDKISSNGSVLDGTWHHVVAIRTSGVMKTYVDNQVQTQTANNSLDVSGSTSPLYVGLRVQDNSHPFSGLIDDVKVFNYARTPAQIAWDYNRGRPVAYWKFDECQGLTAYDSSGNSNTGTITIGATIPQSTAGTCLTPTDGTGAWYNGLSGKFNSAMSFDGVDDYVNLGTSLNSGLVRSKPFSIGAWIKTSASSAQQIITNADWDSPYTGIEFTMNSNGTLTFDLNQNASKLIRITTTATINNGNWHYVSIIYSGSGAASGALIYIDGVAMATTTAYDNTDADATSSTNLEVGARDVANSPFNGLIDDVKIYNYALTVQQIKMDYNQGSAVRFGPTTGRP